MIMDPASAIKREVCQLIDLQIETLRQESPGLFPASRLQGARRKNPNALRRLDRIGRTKVKLKFAKAF